MSYSVTPMDPDLRRFAVEVFCRTMLMRGLVESHRRLTDLVNQADPYLGVIEVYTHPYSLSTVPALESHQQGIISKTSIVMVAELELATTTLATPVETGMRIPKMPHRILAFTDDFAINADIHLTEGADMATFLTMSHSQFVPVTNATVHPTQTGTQLTGFERPFLLINTEHIVYLGEDHELTPN
jgi:hypothetical protein